MMRRSSLSPPWHPEHPVLELIRRRRTDGSKPGSRNDTAKLALCVEGGGMRGIASCAMLAALEDHGCADVFDAVYGGSSGSVNAAYFLAGDLWRSLAIYYDELASKRFIDLNRILRGRPPLDVDFAFDTVFDKAMPLDYDAVLASATPLHVSITLVDEMETVTPATFESAADLKSALRAGAWLPVATSGTALFRGRRALDGGTLVSHPSRLALRDGCTHLLSLSTRAGLQSSARPDPVQWYAGIWLDRLRPGLGRRFREAHHVGRHDRAQLTRWRLRPGTPAVLDICPARGVEINRLEIRSERLQTVARSAYETMAWALNGRRERAYPRYTIVADKTATRAPDSRTVPGTRE